MAGDERDKLQEANIRYQLEQENRKLRLMDEMTNRAILGALTTVFVVDPDNPEGWQRVEMSVRKYGHCGEEAVRSVKRLWERIRDDPDSRYLASLLLGLSREGMAYRDLAEKIGKCPELMNLFQRARED